MLRRYGLRGTYYASLGLAGTQAPTGEIFLKPQIPELLEVGHELGCHTYSHCHAWDTPPEEFEAAVMANAAALRTISPRSTFDTLAYPVSCPRPLTKRRVQKIFACCRGGGQRINVGTVDRNHLHAFFIEKSKGTDDWRAIIADNRRRRGWLIFATHAISEHPTPYGCTPRVFEEVVRCSVESGATILPVREAWARASAQCLKNGHESELGSLDTRV